MAKHNARNARIKRDYFHYLKDAQGRDDASIDKVAKALVRFEESTGHKDFNRFHIQQAVAFKTKLAGEKNPRTGKQLSYATLHSTLCACRAFFIWLADKPGYKSRISYTDAEYFNLSDKDVRKAKAAREKPVPTLEQVQHVLATMPAASDIEKRNRALVAFALLTGARADALATLKLKHIDLEQGNVFQDGREVRTKGSKTITTWFCPVGGDALQIFTEWCEHFNRLACPTTIRTASEIRWFCMERGFAGHQKSLRPGRRISGTKGCSQPLPVIARSQPHGRPS